MAPRGRVQLRRIEDRVSRQVRFSKRRTGLFKKAAQLAVLCDAEVALVVFSPAGKVYHYSSNSLEDTYDRFQQFARAGQHVNEADQNGNNNQEDASSDLQSRVREITNWAVQNNAEESDAKELEKLEGLLRNALRVTRSKKIQKLAKKTSRVSKGATRAAMELANRIKERREPGTGLHCATGE